MARLPTGKDSVRNGTGKPDFSLDLIVSKEASKLVEVSGYGGYEGRGKTAPLLPPRARVPRRSRPPYPSRGVCSGGGWSAGLVSAPVSFIPALVSSRRGV